jgi:hypothetical protein
MFFSVDDDPDGDPTAGDGTLICLSALPQEDELLVNLLKVSGKWQSSGQQS